MGKLIVAIAIVGAVLYGFHKGWIQDRFRPRGRQHRQRQEHAARRDPGPPVDAPGEKK